MDEVEQIVLGELNNCKVGECWDFVKGGDRWGSCSKSKNEDDEIDGAVSNGAFEDGDEKLEELSKRMKRMSIEIGPSSFVSRRSVRRARHDLPNDLFAIYKIKDLKKEL